MALCLPSLSLCVFGCVVLFLASQPFRTLPSSFDSFFFFFAFLWQPFQCSQQVCYSASKFIITAPLLFNFKDSDVHLRKMAYVLIRIYFLPFVIVNATL